MIVLSDGLLSSARVREGVRYPARSPYCGWWLFGDDYKGDLSTIRNVHVGDLLSNKPELRKILALDSGFCFSQEPQERVWFEESVAKEPIVQKRGSISNTGHLRRASKCSSPGSNKFSKGQRAELLSQLIIIVLAEELRLILTSRHRRYHKDAEGQQVSEPACELQRIGFEGIVERICALVGLGSIPFGATKADSIMTDQMPSGVG